MPGRERVGRVPIGCGLWVRGRPGCLAVAVRSRDDDHRTVIWTNLGQERVVRTHGRYLSYTHGRNVVGHESNHENPIRVRVRHHDRAALAQDPSQAQASASTASGHDAERQYVVVASADKDFAIINPQGEPHGLKFNARGVKRHRLDINAVFDIRSAVEDRYTFGNGPIDLTHAYMLPTRGRLCPARGSGEGSIGRSNDFLFAPS